MAELAGSRRQVAGVVTALAVLGIVAFDLVVVWEWTSGQPFSYPYWLESSLGGLAFAAVGLVVTVRVQGNPVGPLMLVLPVECAVQGLAGTFALTGTTHGTPPQLIALCGGIFAAGQVLGAAVVATMLLLVPDGRPLTRRWGIVVASVVTLGLIATVTQFLSGPSFDPTGGAERDALPGYPDGLALVPDSVRALVINVSGVAQVDMVVGILLGVISLVLRWRRTSGVERRRSGWAIAGALGTPVLIVITSPFPQVEIRGGTVIWAVALLLVPLGLAVAMLRHGLYDLDRVVSRTVAYAVVTVLVVTVYAVIVTLTSALVGSQSGWVVAASTLAAAALFRPLLSRVQRVVDRQFNREKVDGQRAVEEFGAGLVDQVDPDHARFELIDVTDRILAPQRVSLWTPDSRHE
jgi:hypothetical protein